MKEIIVNVDSYNENSIRTVEGDNLSEVYKIYILKNKRRIDLTNKIAVMAYVDEYGSKRSNILNLNITNAAEGEIELPITNVISSENGVYACQIAIYGENNSLEQTAPFSLIVENNIFSKISNTAINSSNFHILSEAIKTANEYSEKLKEGTENIELQYAYKLNEKLDKDGIVTMANMGQDVKEAMTGGSVAVVGKNAVGTVNIQDNAVTGEKIDINLINYIKSNKITFTVLNILTKIDGDVQNGAILDKKNMRIDINDGNTGHLSYIRTYFPLDFSSLKGKTIKLKFTLNDSNISEIGADNLNLYVSSFNGKETLNNIGTNLKKEIKGECVVLTTDFLVKGDEVELRPYVQIWNPKNILKNKCSLTILDINYRIEEIGGNDIVLRERELNLLQGNIKEEKNKILENLTTEKNTIIKTEYKNSKYYYFIVNKCFDTLLEIKAKVFKDNVYQIINIPIINCENGSIVDKITTTGKYAIESNGFLEIQITNTCANNPTVGLSICDVDMYPSLTSPFKVTSSSMLSPLQSKKIKDITSPNRLLGIRNGKLISAFRTQFKQSNNMGDDKFPTFLGKIDDSTVGVSRCMFLENGYIFVILDNGKAYISKDEFNTWELVKTFDVPPHYGIGGGNYKNIITICEYSIQKNPAIATKGWVSEDYGQTWRKVFDILETGIKNNCHMHDLKFDPYEKMLWATIGDGIDTQMIFYSKNMGGKWYKAAEFGYAPTQSTEIIPLRNVVLFTSDSRMVSVIKYNRPNCGTIEGAKLEFELLELFKCGWGKNNYSEVPIGSLSAIDYRNNLAYFGYILTGNSKTGNDGDELKYGNIYCTDGITVNEIFKNDTIVTEGVASIQLYNNDLFVKFGNRYNGVLLEY